MMGGTDELIDFGAYSNGYSDCKDKWLSVLDSIVWYNGLGDIVLSWEDKEPDMSGYISPDYRDKGYDVETVANLEFIWMIAVLLYGDYGTSPRSGWIKDCQGFKTFIHAITKTYRYSEGEQ